VRPEGDGIASNLIQHQSCGQRTNLIDRWLTLLSGGELNAASSMLSNPTIAISRGTKSPAALNASIRPIALRSVATMTAVGRAAAASTSLAAAAPPSKSLLLAVNTRPESAEMPCRSSVWR